MAKFCKNCGKPLGFLDALFSERSLCSEECRIAYETKISEAERKSAELSKPKEESDYLQAILRMYLTRANESAENKFIGCMWSSWALGGNAVTAFLRGYYRGNSGLDLNAMDAMVDSQAKAKSLLELGIQAMVSRWFWKWYSEKGHSVEEREDAVRVALINNQTFLDIKCEDTVNLYLGFNREFLQCMPRDKDTKPSVPLPFRYVEILWQRYWECITGEQIVDWARLRFPLESHQQVLAACYKGKHRGLDGTPSILNPSDIITLWAGIIKAGGVMFEEFKEMYEKP